MPLRLFHIVMQKVFTNMNNEKMAMQSVPCSQSCAKTAKGSQEITLWCKVAAAALSCFFDAHPSVQWNEQAVRAGSTCHL